MSISLSKALAMAIGLWMFAEQSVHGQTNTADLRISARLWLNFESAEPKAFVTLCLINTSDRELTVLTKHLNRSVSVSGAVTNSTDIQIGYANHPVTYEGHSLIPSLYELGPVKLRPDEAAFIQQEIVPLPKGVTKETPFTITYAVSPEWGSRFGVWSGSVTVGPMKGVVKNSPSAPARPSN